MEQMTHARSSMLDDRGRSQRSTLRFLVLLSLFTVTAPVITMAGEFKALICRMLFQ